MKTFNQRKLVAAGFAVAMCSGLVTIANAGDSTVSLRQKYKAGDQTSYQTNGQISIPIPGGAKGMPAGPQGSNSKAPELSFPVNSTQKITVTKVLANGNAEVELSMAGPTALPSGKPGPTKAVTTVKATMTPLGALTVAKSGGGDSANEAIGALTGVGSLGSITIYLPSGPVKPGDTWTKSIPMPQLSATGTVAARYVSNSQVGRYKTAHVKLTITIPVLTMLDEQSKITSSAAKAVTKVSGKVVMTYDDDFAIAEGKLVRSAGNGTTDLTITQSAKSPGAPAPNAKPQSMAIKAKIVMTSTLVQ